MHPFTLLLLDHHLKKGKKTKSISLKHKLHITTTTRTGLSRMPFFIHTIATKYGIDIDIELPGFDRDVGMTGAVSGGGDVSHSDSVSFFYSVLVF